MQDYKVKLLFLLIGVLHFVQFFLVTFKTVSFMITLTHEARIMPTEIKIIKTALQGV